MSDPSPIPDRVSVDRASPYFFDRFGGLEVRFDGQLRPGDVVEFCVSEGWIRTQVRNGRGQIKIERGRFVTVKRRGVVEPEWRASYGD